MIRNRIRLGVIQDFVFLCRKMGSVNGNFGKVYNKCADAIQKSTL